MLCGRTARASRAIRCLNLSQIVRHQSVGATAAASPDEYDAVPHDVPKGAPLISDGKFNTPNLAKDAKTLPSTNEQIDYTSLIVSMADESARQVAPAYHQDDSQYKSFKVARNVLASSFLNRLIDSKRPLSREVLFSSLDLATSAGSELDVHRTLALLHQYWIPLPGEMIHTLVEHYCENKTLELALELLDKQVKGGNMVPIRAWTTLLDAMFEQGSLDEAFELLQEVPKKSGHDTTLLAPAFYFHALSCFANNFHSNGVQWIWQQVILPGHLASIDQGICTKILSVCGRVGLPILATDVIKYMDRMGIHLKEYHYAMLIDSYCVAGDVKNAFNILDIMRQAEIPPLPTTASAILKFMSKDVDLIDRAFFTLQDLKEGGASIDVAAFNVIIDACVVRGDISRAVATFEDYTTLGVTPNIHTLNSLVAGCVGQRRKDVALSMVQIFNEKLSIVPNADTYASIIFVCLMQDDYEDAFSYLEEMKEEGFQPTLETYRIIIRKCVQQGDPRHQIAYDEMKGWGYRDERTDRIVRDQVRGTFLSARSSGVFDTMHSITDSESMFLPIR